MGGAVLCGRAVTNRLQWASPAPSPARHQIRQSMRQRNTNLRENAAQNRQGGCGPGFRSLSAMTADHRQRAHCRRSDRWTLCSRIRRDAHRTGLLECARWNCRRDGNRQGEGFTDLPQTGPDLRDATSAALFRHVFGTGPKGHRAPSRRRTRARHWRRAARRPVSPSPDWSPG
jgi:hypothetical protein